MDTRELAARVDALLGGAADGKSIATPLPRMMLFRMSHTTQLQPDLYEPIVCLILQGRKETTFGEVTHEIGPGQSLLVSHDAPVLARITAASPEIPYISVVLRLDLALLRSLYDEVGEEVAELAAPGPAVSDADPRLIDCLARYVALVDDPIEARVMTGMLLRELHFRLLMAPGGGVLRELLRHDSHASHIARAIALIRRDFRSAMAVPALAREVGMSPSSFHKHFRDVTSSTPLQYQKSLRLLEARRMLVSGEHSVSSVAYDVGYGSPNQFSREYARRYGVPPSAHLAAAVPSPAEL